MAFSRDGNKLIVPLDDQNEADILHFDRCSGRLYDSIHINHIDSLNTGDLISGAFSADGKRVYINAGYGDLTNATNAIFQYSLGTSNINSTREVIYPDTNQSKFIFGNLCLAPNNKIYLAVSEPTVPYQYSHYSPYNQYLWIINSPDSLGSKCHFQPYGYYLGDSSRSYGSLPNNPNYNLGPTSIYAASAGKDTTWCSDSTQSVMIGSPTVPNIVYHWSPGKGLSDSTIAQPMARPDSSTYYIVTVTDTSQNGTSCTTRNDTVLVSVQKCDTVGIEAPIAIGMPIRVFPNPANNKLVIESSLRNKGAFFKLSDAVGHCVLQKTIDDLKTVIDISALPAGLYIYRMKEQSGKVQVVR